MRRDNRWAALWIVTVIAVSCVPYLIAWAAAPEGRVFAGILYNPLDGQSYLAKLRQGWEGEWLYRLAFTEEPQQGAFIYTFYLFLGHLARMFGLSLPLTFHLARALASVFMLAALWRLLGRVFAESVERKRAFLLATFGAGLGWLFPTLEPLLPDLWVPEAYLFYSALSNFHFPLALGLMAMLADSALTAAQGSAAEGETVRRPRQRPGLYVAAGAYGLALTVAQPFAVPVILAVLVVFAGVRAARRQTWREVFGVAAAAGLASLPLLIYDWWLYNHHTGLKVWAAQNISESGPLWHWLAGGGLLAVLALVGLWVAARRSPSPLDVPALWLLIVAAGVYAPSDLQRRFSMGLLIPVGILAAVGFSALTTRLRARLRGLLFALTLGFVGLTSVVLLALGTAGGLSGEPRLFLSRDEADALAQLRERGGGQGVVLASPELSAFVPAWAGNPVVYGHPLETIHAEEKQAAVEHFFADLDAAQRTQFMTKHRVAFLVWGPREAAISAGMTPQSLGMRLLLREGAVEVWAVGDAP